MNGTSLVENVGFQFLSLRQLHPVEHSPFARARLKPQGTARLGNQRLDRGHRASANFRSLSASFRWLPSSLRTRVRRQQRGDATASRARHRAQGGAARHPPQASSSFRASRASRAKWIWLSQAVATRSGRSPLKLCWPVTRLPIASRVAPA